MTLTLELKPEIEADLVARARLKGVSLDAYIHSILEQLARPRSSAALGVEEWEKAFEELAGEFPQTPVLSDEAIGRESLYRRDHE
jgi:hypothetical protein